LDNKLSFIRRYLNSDACVGLKLQYETHYDYHKLHERNV